jgi:hypothetical protein
MRTHRRLLPTILLLVTAALPAVAGTGLTFLTLGVGGRGLGMGEAYSTGTADPAAMHYNPASLSSIDVTTVAFMHRSWIEGTNAEYVAGGFSLGRLSLGFSTYWLSIRDIEIRSVPGPATGTFTAQDFSIGMSAAYDVTPEISVGLTVKYLYEKILVDDAGGMAFDFGGVYTTGSGIRIGASVANLGSVNALRDVSTSLPKLFRGGISYTTRLENPSATVTGAADFVTPLGDGGSHLHLGGEAILYGAVAVRAGYQTGYDARGLTLGTGIAHGIVTVDYAFAPTQYDLGSTHTISLSLQLN